MEDNVAIKVQNVSKSFKLPHEKTSSLKSAIIKPFKKSKGYEVQRALKGISFDVKKGEFFGIVGRNGSGKSTLLKILAGIYQPTEGAISVKGKLVPFIELGVGFNPELSGRENVYLNGSLMGFSRKEIDVMYEDIVSFAELEDFMDQKLKNYSSGMQVRLAFSVATRAEADILLIDEVLAVGDADFQRKCFQYFRNLKKEKRTVVFVSHDMEAVREYCDSCILIDDSEIIYKGRAEKAAEKYTQLFNTPETEITDNTVDSKSSRWGNGAARFTAVKAATKDDNSVVIDATLSFIERMEGPIMGVLIKNGSGETVCGTNNKILRQRLGVAEQGDKLNIQWTFPDIFSDDKYSVEVAVTHNDGVTQADWWHEAATFRIKKSTTTPHIVSPDIKMAVK